MIKKKRPRSSAEKEQLASNEKVVGSNPTEGTKKSYPVICQEWIEKERGWGQRPDGATLHLTLKDKDAYIKAYWATMPDDAPDEYEAPSGSPKVLEVDHEVYVRIKNSKNGIHIWQGEYSSSTSKGSTIDETPKHNVVHVDDLPDGLRG